MAALHEQGARKPSLIPSGIKDVLRHHRAGTASEYINQFVAEFPNVVMSLVDDPAYSSWARDRRLEKEITESLAAVARVKRLLIKCGVGVDGDGAGVHFVEMCSGKDMDISHTTKLPNVNFHACDILTDDMATLVESAAADRKACILIGVHLCGALSVRAIHLWKESGAAGLVLSPCCLPRRRRTDAFGYNAALLARKMRVNPYTIWSLELYGLLGNCVGRSRDMSIDEDVIGIKNVFITACKPQQC